MTPIEPHLALAFAMNSAPGAYAVLLGAGTSMAAGIPAAWDIQQDLIGKLAAAKGETPTDPSTWFRDTYGNDPTYDWLLGELTHTPEERQQLLRHYFEPDPEGTDRRPTPAHRALATLAKQGHVRVILTTNFDRLIETALRAAGVEPVVVGSPTDLAGLGAPHSRPCTVVHLHGDYLQPDTMLNTPTELAGYDPALDTYLDRVFDEYGLIILGWSAKYDPALRNAWSRCPARRYASYWIDAHALNDSATELATRRGTTIVTDTADHFLTATTDAITAIAEAAMQHPATTAAAVQLSKRLLASEAIPIRAHDLLRAEFGKIHASPIVNATTWDAAAAGDIYRGRLATLQAECHTATALVATLAYWGNPATDTWWIHDLDSFAISPNVAGSSALIALAAAPATFLFYSGGIAAAAAQRWDLTARMLTDFQATDLYEKTGTGPLPQRVRPTRTLSGDAVRALEDYLSPILREHLALDTNAVRTAWERFLYLDLIAAQTRGNPTTSTAPYIRVTDLGSREYVPVPSSWFRALLASRAGEALHHIAAARDLIAAADLVDQTIHDIADRRAFRGTTFQSGTWLPADAT